MNKKIILVGGGGHCKSVIDVAISTGFEILGILEKAITDKSDVMGYKIIGTDDDIPKFVGKAEFVITVGQIKNCSIRKRIANIIDMAGGKYATIVANDAYVADSAIIEDGTVIMHKAFVNADVKIGKHCIVNTNAIVEHEVTIGDYCHLSTGSIVNGGAVIGNESFIGSQSVVNQMVRLNAPNIVIGSLSVVNRDINMAGVYVGSPLRKIG